MTDDELVSEYRRLTLERIERIETMLGGAIDTPELLRELHTMKGDSMMMGFREIAARLRRIEEQVRGGDREILAGIRAIASMVRSTTAGGRSDDPAE